MAVLDYLQSLFKDLNCKNSLESEREGRVGEKGISSCGDCCYRVC